MVLHNEKGNMREEKKKFGLYLQSVSGESNYSEKVSKVLVMEKRLEQRAVNEINKVSTGFKAS